MQKSEYKNCMLLLNVYSFFQRRGGGGGGNERGVYLYISSFLHIYFFRGLGSGKVVEPCTGCYVLLF